MDEVSPRMVRPSCLLPARVELCIGEHSLPAVPVHLDGQEASVVVERTPRHARHVRLLLDWEEGGRTELSATLRSVGGHGHLAHLDLCGVGGDWRPFLAWLGTHTSS